MKRLVLLSALFVLSIVDFGYSQVQTHKLCRLEAAEISTNSMKSYNFNVDYLKSRPFSISTQFFNKGTIKVGDLLELNLFPTSSFESVVDRVYTDVNNTTTYVTKLKDFNFAFAVISLNGEDVLVSIDIPELNQKFSSRIKPDDRTLYLLKLDTKNLDYIEGSHIFDFEKNDAAKIDGPIETNKYNNYFSSKLPDDFLSNDLYHREAEIDMLVVYTANAATWANSNEGNINNTVANAMAWCNIASAYSDLGITFNLAYSDMVTYTESGDSGTDLGRLRNSSDGHMDIIHEWRDTYNADMVSLLTQVTDVGGVGYLLRKKHGDIDTGYSITRVQQASNSYTMIHEMGHNMGAHHHANQNFQPGPTYWEDWPENTWSAGWYWTDNGGNFFCDLMTYSSGQYFNELDNSLQMGRVPVFSSPRVFENGIATGEHYVGDNASTLIQVKHFVSKYRDPITLQYCAAAGGSSSISIASIETESIYQESGNLSYYDFSFIQPGVAIGGSMYIKVNINGAHPSNQLLAWVDWNDDKEFDAETELVFSLESNTSQFVFSVTPPENTEPGQKRLRMRLNSNLPFNNPNLTPCGSNGAGEVKDISINVLPEGCEPVTIIHQPENKAVCRNTGNVNLEVVSSGSETISHQWQYMSNGLWINVENNLPSGATYSGMNSSVLNVSGISPAGTFYYRCKLSNCESAASTLSANALIKTVSNVSQPTQISGNTAPCQGLTLAYFVDNIENAIFIWEVPGDWTIIGETNGNAISAMIGEKSGNVSVMASNDCGASQPRLLPVTVSPKPPIPTLSLLDGNVLQSNATSGNRWFRNNLIILGASGQTYTVTSDGYYHVRVTIAGCNSETSNVIPIGVVSVAGPEFDNTTQIFPNPVTDRLVIQNNGLQQNASYIIFNIAGQMIDSATFEKRIDVNMSNLAKGIYLVKVVTNEGTVSRKIIKQ